MNYTGGNDNEILTGGDFDDLIVGNGGDDTLTGGGGADAIYGDERDGAPAVGNDILNGDAGNDLLVGGFGGDVLAGGNGLDILYGDATDGAAAGGNDILNGDAENDFLVGGFGVDQLYGGEGNDILVPGLASRVSLSGRTYSFSFGQGVSPISGTGSVLGDSTGELVDGGAGNDIAYLAFLDGRGVTFDNRDPALRNAVVAGGVEIGSVTGVERLVFFAGAGNDVVLGGISPMF